MFLKFMTVSVVVFAAIWVSFCHGEDSSADYEQESDLNAGAPPSSDEQSHISTDTDDFDMEDAIEKIEALTQITEKMTSVKDFIHSEDIDNFYEYMIQAVDNIQRAISLSNNIHKFMKANGVLRILSNNLKNTHVMLRTKLLLLLKDIFDLAPNAAESLLPLNIVDRLIEIFENDDNLAVKAHALDILHKWLPNNPQVQVRVMKISGLETFYDQIDKLGIDVVKILMQLFNKILKEHLDVNNNKMQLSIDDVDKIKTYQSIGFLERMSSSKVCNGLLNIFELLWSYNKNENDNIDIVLELVMNVKPFCLKFYKKKAKASELFEAMLKYIEGEEKLDHIRTLDVNVTAVAATLKDYLYKEKRAIKDEF